MFLAGEACQSTCYFIIESLRVAITIKKFVAKLNNKVPYVNYSFLWSALKPKVLIWLVLVYFCIRFVDFKEIIW
jgi:hypothetical protein